MSDRMTPIPFSQLVTWIIKEHDEQGTVFGLQRPYIAKPENMRMIFGRSLETPIGPAAGPHTQLTQNIVAAYYAGSRFFELKTVQMLDGEDLPVSKPCIKADDECYNCEWSTELRVPEAMDEYIKAWFILHIIAKEYDLGSADGFQFNMSVGYDLEGIKQPKMDQFIEGMKNASGTAVFQECKSWLLQNTGLFQKVTAEDVEAIPAEVCNSVTLSTLHGCPPQEIERIATYLIEEKGLNTFIKCNPTLLGYEFARKTLDEMGYDYIAFGDFHFLDDLQYSDAVPMLRRLMALCSQKGLEFGVKITNTFPVDVKQQELPSEEMYMSGKSLYPLSIALAARLAQEFDGELRISYSGGADAYNIEGIVAAGIWPVTVATTLLKPGGYQRCKQITELVETVGEKNFNGVNPAAVAKLAEEAKTNRFHVKDVKPLPSYKGEEKVPLLDCFMSPCKEGCPIHQDVTTYLQLAEAGKYEEAMKVITEKNPLPFITGTICAHYCQGQCTRNFYEESIAIRSVKLECAYMGYDALMKNRQRPEISTDHKVAVIGGGPAGLAAAYFLARGGAAVTIFEKAAEAGGVIRYVIPEFRIRSEAIDKDIALVSATGVEIRCNTEVKDVAELKSQGYTHVVVAIGASEPGILKLEEGGSMNALDFLAEFKKTGGKVAAGKNVVVIGGGNTAMDTARAAKHNAGVENVYLVYRRTKRYMPADQEELVMALEDGVIFQELLAPVTLKDNILVCRKTVLSDYDASGRRSVVEIPETVEIPADLVIASVGERVDTDFYNANGIAVDSRGKALTGAKTYETGVPGVYVVGDAWQGPSTVVKGIRDARAAAEAIIGRELAQDFDSVAGEETIYSRRGILKTADPVHEAKRCLTCGEICENCKEVCPNRANLAIAVPGLEKHQIVHVDYMCNECGNCKSFCPYSSSPYLDKFTLFANEADFQDSENQGFTVINRDTAECRVRYLGNTLTVKAGEPDGELPDGLGQLMLAVIRDYDYLLA